MLRKNNLIIKHVFSMLKQIKDKLTYIALKEFEAFNEQYIS